MTMQSNITPIITNTYDLKEYLLIMVFMINESIINKVTDSFGANETL
jgi:hypothetical protein